MNQWRLAMNLYGRHYATPRGADEFLNAIVEEAIAETVTLPPTPPHPREPVSAEGFLADAVVFLRTRPDARDLLRRLHETVNGGTAAPHDAPQPGSEAPPEALAVEVASETAPKRRSEEGADNR